MGVLHSRLSTQRQLQVQLNNTTAVILWSYAYCDSDVVTCVWAGHAVCFFDLRSISCDWHLIPGLGIRFAALGRSQRLLRDDSCGLDVDKWQKYGKSRQEIFMGGSAGFADIRFRLQIANS